MGEDFDKINDLVDIISIDFILSNKMLKNKVLLKLEMMIKNVKNLKNLNKLKILFQKHPNLININIIIRLLKIKQLFQLNKNKNKFTDAVLNIVWSPNLKNKNEQLLLCKSTAEFLKKLLSLESRRSYKQVVKIIFMTTQN